MRRAVHIHARVTHVGAGARVDRVPGASTALAHVPPHAHAPSPQPLTQSLKTLVSRTSASGSRWACEGEPPREHASSKPARKRAPFGGL